MLLLAEMAIIPARPGRKVDFRIIVRRPGVGTFKARISIRHVLFVRSKISRLSQASIRNRFRLLITINGFSLNIWLRVHNPSITIQVPQEASVVSLYDLRGRRCVQK